MLVRLCAATRAVGVRRCSTHVSVLRDEAVRAWRQDKAGGLFVDGTVGAGGHTEALLSADPQSRVIGVDRDVELVQVASRRLQGPNSDRLRLVHGNYGALDTVLASLGETDGVDGVLLDVGVNSLHFDDARRGFSFLRDGPLDMRFDQTVASTTAADIVNTMPEAALAQLFRVYGEEPRARAIAAAIVAQRDEAPLSTTADLAQVVEEAVGRPRRRTSKGKGKRSKHPATRVFQALRIAVNEELDWLESGLWNCMSCLRPHAALAVITFHSLEGRTVKRLFRQWEAEGVGKCRPRKAIHPSDAEVAANPRARSATMRVFVKG